MIDKLEFLIAVARERNFRRAAETCGVTQPTLSAGIKQLEDNLGVLLVQRSSRFHGLTPEGDRVLEWARRIAGDARAMRDELRGLRRALGGQLRLAVVPGALALVAHLTSAFHARHPDVRFTILSRSATQVLEMLGNLEVDAGLTYLDGDSVGKVRSLPLFSERYRLVVPAGSPLAARDSIGWSALDGLSLCLLTPDMQNRRFIDALLRQAGATVTPGVESNSVTALLSHVRTSGWMSILPTSLLEGFGPVRDVRTIPLVQPDATHTIGLVVPEREPASPLTEALLLEGRRLVPAESGPDISAG